MNTFSAAVVGIDVSKSKLDAALIVGGKTKNKVVTNTKEGYAELVKWLGKQHVMPADVHVCMEATGVYSEPVALALQAMGMKVSMVNPARVKGFGESESIRNKNDRADAGVIARYCAAMHPPLWQAPPLELRLLRGWNERVSALNEMRQQEANRIEAHQFAGQTELAQHVKEHVAWIDVQLKQLKKDIDDHIDRYPDLKRDADLLTSIPGIGRLTAAKVLGRVGDLRRFTSAKELAAFLGVTPRQRQSGSSVRGRTMMSRMGCRDLRAALYMPSLTACTYNPILRAFAERLRASGMVRMAVVGAVMRKLVHQMYGVIRTSQPFDPNYLEKTLAIQDGI
jgi:transposase